MCRQVLLADCIREGCDSIVAIVSTYSVVVLLSVSYGFSRLLLRATVHPTRAIDANRMLYSSCIFPPGHPRMRHKSNTIYISYRQSSYFWKSSGGTGSRKCVTLASKELLACQPHPPKAHQTTTQIVAFLAKSLILRSRHISLPVYHRQGLKYVSVEPATLIACGTRLTASTANRGLHIPFDKMSYSNAAQKGPKQSPDEVRSTLQTPRLTL